MYKIVSERGEYQFDRYEDMLVEFAAMHESRLTTTAVMYQWIQESQWAGPLNHDCHNHWERIDATPEQVRRLIDIALANFTAKEGS